MKARNRWNIRRDYEESYPKVLGFLDDYWQVYDVFEPECVHKQASCPLFETFCVIDGQIVRWHIHVARILASCDALEWKDEVDYLRSLVNDALEEMGGVSPNARIKVRLEYDESGLIRADASLYVPRTVRSLRLVEANSLNYALKSTDRTAINRTFAQRNGCDDVLIVRGGRLTDTSIANIALWHTEQQRWFTPSRPLLYGTHRAALLFAGTIFEDDALTPERLSEFSRVRLFNAMLQWGEIDLPIEAIQF